MPSLLAKLDALPLIVAIDLIIPVRTAAVF